MGKTYKPILFFDENIKLLPNSATTVKHLRPITLKQFANGKPIKLSQCIETGDYIAESENGFIEGPELI